MMTPEETEQLKQMALTETSLMCTMMSLSGEQAEVYQDATAEFFDLVGELMILSEGDISKMFNDSNLGERMNKVMVYIIFLAGMLSVVTTEASAFDAVGQKLRLAISSSLIWLHRAAYKEGFNDALLDTGGFDSFVDDLDFNDE